MGHRHAVKIEMDTYARRPLLPVPVPRGASGGRVRALQRCGRARRGPWHHRHPAGDAARQGLRSYA